MALLLLASALLPPLGLLCLVALSFFLPEAAAARHWAIGLVIVAPAVVTGSIIGYDLYLVWWFSWL